VAVIAAIVLSVTLTSLEREKAVIFKAFRAIPKAVLSQVVRRISVRTTVQEEAGEPISPQEQRTLRAFTSLIDKNVNWFSQIWPVLVPFAIYLVSGIAAILVFIITPSSTHSRIEHMIGLYVDAPRLVTFVHELGICMLRLFGISSRLFTFMENDEIQDLGHLLMFDFDTGWPYALIDMVHLYDGIQDLINGIRMQNNETGAVGLTHATPDLINWLAAPICDQEVEVAPLMRFQCQSVETILALASRQMEQIVDVTNHAILASFSKTFYGEPTFFPMKLIDPTTLIAYYEEILPATIPWQSVESSFFIVFQLAHANEMFMERAADPLNDILESAVSTGINNGFLVPLIVFTVIIVITGLILVMKMFHLSDGALFSLRLLLFCPSSVLLQTLPIQKVLSNDFSSSDESQNDDVDFFESIVSQMLDGVVFLSSHMKVISVNTAVESVLGLEIGDVRGKSLASLFVAPEGSASLATFLGAVSAAMNCQRPPTINMDIEHCREGELVHLHVRMITISWSGQVQKHSVNREAVAIVVLLIKDISSAIAASTLLREEGIKSEKLLLMILPPVIVTKLRSGIKNLSFAVKSASILFLDIVSFTPWCGAHEASYVMSILNRMFLEYDRLIKRHDRLMKIKCIGDCYMCAGGIFDELDQPHIHAGQMVSFGLDMIHALQLLNIELTETLRIRVGVNTGGPIVAGVIGTETPTFDILGPPIALAAAMESRGTPMCVHIPQHCYNLIYDSNFIFQERGEVQVKGNLYRTYLAIGYQGE
jgi:PAS domain S-box-containing protein